MNIKTLFILIDVRKQEIKEKRKSIIISKPKWQKEVKYINNHKRLR